MRHDKEREKEELQEIRERGLIFLSLKEADMSEEEVENEAMIFKAARTCFNNAGTGQVCLQDISNVLTRQDITSFPRQVHGSGVQNRNADITDHGSTLCENKNAVRKSFIPN